MLYCMFKDICHHLHDVISYEAFFDSIDPHIDLTQPCSDQGQRFHSDKSVIDHILGVHGTLHFYHNSFYDLLRDPTRSGVFCVNATAFYFSII